MGTIWVREFTGGLDTRRMPETTPGSALIRASDGHVTRGGEFEKRAAFVPEYTLPAGTVGMWYDRTSIYVFGHGATPAGLPTGVAYQRLQHPSTTPALVRLLSADLYAGKIYAVGEFADGSVHHFYDGVRVTDWFDGRARATFTVTSGEAAAELTNLQVGGVAAISAPVVWDTSAEATAAAIALAINTHTSSPEYTATAVGANVNIVAATPGAGANGRTVVFTVTGALVLTPPTGLVLANGATSTAFQPGSFVKTVGAKMNSVSGPNFHFSGIKAPTKWTTDAVGAGFIDMSTETSGSEELTALAKYQQWIAIFAERTTQIWYVDPNPENNRQTQVLNNTGTISPRSVTQFGDNDLFYLDESGLRSLRSRDSSNSAATTDIGVPVDTLVIEKLSQIGIGNRRDVVGAIEPRDGRFWLAIKDTIFVFSFFNGAQVSAWSTYTPSVMVGGVATPFNVDDMVVFRRRVYIRSGNKIYVYGGLSDDQVYDGTIAEAWLPYLDAEDPTRTKSFTGVDAALTGEWSIYAAMNPKDLSAEDKIGVLFETTFGDDAVPAIGDSTHFSLRFRSVGDGPAKLSSAVIHYVGDKDED